MNHANHLLSDEEVVSRVRAGEKALFEVLMRRHNQRVYRTARAILRDDTEAEDVMQDAYVRAFQHLDQFEGRSQFSTWLTRIAVNEALSRKRQGSRMAPLEGAQEESLMTTGSNPEQQTSDTETRALLEAALGKLNDDFHAVFVLRSIEGLSGAEAARCLGVSEDVVKARLSRARRRLRELILETLEPAFGAVYEFHLSRCDRVVSAVLQRIEAL